MEEYRRKYLSPSYRNSSTIQILTHDRSVSDLRQQLHQCRQMQNKFEDLSVQILKLQRQNKLIQQQKCNVESQLLRKIQEQKEKINNLQKDIKEYKNSAEKNSVFMQEIQSENIELQRQVQRIQGLRQRNHIEVVEIQEYMKGKSVIEKDVKSKIAQYQTKVKQINQKCQKTSQKLEEEYQILKTKEQKLKEDQKVNQQLQKKLSQLNQQRQLLTKKVQASDAEVTSLQNEYMLNKSEQSRKQLQCLALQKQNVRIWDACHKNKSDSKKYMLENGQIAGKLKNRQFNVFNSLNDLNKSRQYLQKMNLREVQLKKENDRLWQVASQLSQTLREEQEGYNRIIGHMRQSIQQDEQAIQSLVKQATTLETMIN